MLHGTPLVGLGTRVRNTDSVCRSRFFVVFRPFFFGDASGNFPCSRAAAKRPPTEHAFFPEASPKNTVGTLRRNTIGTLNQCSEPAFRDQLSRSSDSYGTQPARSDCKPTHGMGARQQKGGLQAEGRTGNVGQGAAAAAAAAGSWPPPLRLLRG